MKLRYGPARSLRASVHSIWSLPAVEQSRSTQSVIAVISAFGHLSGALFSPAVTLAFVLARHFSVRRLWVYWSAHLIEAVMAALCLRWLLGDVAHPGTTVPTGAGRAWQSFALEVLLTFFLMVVTVTIATDARAVGQAAALAIRATVARNVFFFAGPISGTSMNPACSLAPALVSFTRAARWVTPFVGTVAGALLYRWMREAGTLPPTHLVREEHHA